jgi:hypothetical protein
MNKHFRSYEELIVEKQQLEALLQAQRQLVHSDINEIKAELKPVFETIQKLTTKDRTNFILNYGTDFVINALLRNLILKRAGWFAKIVVPFLAKNYSSHFVGEHKKKWFQKLVSWLGHKNGEKKEEGHEARG